MVLFYDSVILFECFPVLIQCKIYNLWVWVRYTHLPIYLLSAFSFYFRFSLENCIISIHHNRYGFLWIWYLISAVLNVFSVFYQYPKKWPNKMDGNIQDTYIFRNSLIIIHGSWHSTAQKSFFFSYVSNRERRKVIGRTNWMGENWTMWKRIFHLGKNGNST